ncbi:MAG TPA: hypothetical protein VF622_13315 [Segetibacter sp.]|jgi:hypothetical protein
MNHKLAALAGGIAGALVIKGIHELVKKLDKDVPHFDNLDLTATQKNNFFGGEGDSAKFFSGGLTGDLLNNAIHSSVTGLSDKDADLKSGILGIASGLGAVYLPEVLGINKEHKGHSDKKHHVLSSIYNLAGVFIASKVVEWFNERMHAHDNKRQLAAH